VACETALTAVGQVPLLTACQAYLWLIPCCPACCGPLQQVGFLLRSAVSEAYTFEARAGCAWLHLSLFHALSACMLQSLKLGWVSLHVCSSCAQVASQQSLPSAECCMSSECFAIGLHCRCPTAVSWPHQLQPQHRESCAQHAPASFCTFACFRVLWASWGFSRNLQLTKFLLEGVCWGFLMCACVCVQSRQ
jgi:hypothetical protein